MGGQSGAAKASNVRTTNVEMANKSFKLKGLHSTARDNDSDEFMLSNETSRNREI